MKDFKELAGRYLAFNKKRTILTILGVALSAMVLFVLINTILSFYITSRNDTREKVKYEMVFLCDSEGKANELTKESCIIDFQIAEKPLPEDKGGVQYAVYANMEHPYLMKGDVEEITEKYSVECQTTALGAYYYGEEGSSLVIMGLLALLVAYIFATFGVAVVRNSIQLMTLEQIRDYGMLRCMGSTKKQLKEMVFKMGFLLEISGIAIGIVLGFLVYLPIAITAKMEIGFHVVSVLFIVAAFVFDLYFVMQENCKFVNKLTPIAAVRGEFKIKTRKIKARRKSLVGVLFGIEGDYASKNLKRNPARMWKSVGAMSMGIAMSIVAISMCGILYSYATDDTRQYGKYQVEDRGPYMPGFGQEWTELMMMPEEYAEQLEASKYVSASKDVYEAYLYTSDFMELLDHYTHEFMYESDYGRYKRSGIDWLEKNKDNDKNEWIKGLHELDLAECSLIGYDNEDYADLEEALIEGTTDLNENGILLVNGSCTMEVSNEYINEVWREYTMTDYKVGDVIEFVDYQKLDAWIRTRINGIELQAEDGEFDYELCYNIFYEGYQEMIRQGATRTYVIEGIVNRDVNRAILFDGPRFVLPLDKFFNATGLNEKDTAGKMYHLKGMQLDKPLKKALEGLRQYGAYEQFRYLDTLYMMSTILKVVIGAGCFVLFVVVVNMLNVINTTASDLHLRRKEFAQLRVLGMSKKKLTFTVLLEGLIAAFFSGIIGVALGYLIVTIVMNAVNYGYYVEFSFSWGWSAVLVGISTLILCLTVYLPIRGMKLNMAEELQAGGE